MKARTRQRAIRKIVAALLDSDLSRSEIGDIAFAFIHDKEFTYELESLCRSIADQLHGYAKSGKEVSDYRRDELLEMAQAAVKRKRMKKQDLLTAVKTIVPSVPDSFAEGSKTVNEILCYLSENSSTKVFKEFVEWLESGRDEYLDGILQRAR